jgi:hypothetical protein
VALEALERSLKAGDGKLAIVVLDRLGVFDRQTGSSVDSSLTVAINTLMSRGDGAMVSNNVTRASNVGDDVDAHPHPSGREGPPVDLRLDVPGQNFAITGQLVDSIEVIPEDGTLSDSTGDSSDPNQTGLGG